MANVFGVNVYQINERKAITLTDVSTIYLPTTGVVLKDVTNSPTRSLSTGVNVYSLAITVADGTKYYCRETIAALAALVG